MISMTSKLFTIAALCGLVSCAEMESPTPGQSDDPEAITDATNPQAGPQGGKGEVTANLVGLGPIAYGTVQTSGAKSGGTTNWTSTYNPTFQRYEITITGESYYYTSYATVVTSMYTPRVCTTDSVSGKLLISCYDLAGNPATAMFGFVTSKP